MAVPIQHILVASAVRVLMLTWCYNEKLTLFHSLTHAVHDELAGLSHLKLQCSASAGWLC